MFEFFGWVNLDHGDFNRLWDEGKISSEDYYKEVDQVVNSLEEFINSHEIKYCITRGLNLLISLHFSGLRNHFYKPPIDIFTWIKDNAPYSYGLLYIRDDEDPENQDNFIVYRLARNEITKFNDNLLSPCLETLEKGLYKD